MATLLDAQVGEYLAHCAVERNLSRNTVSSEVSADFIGAKAPSLNMSQFW